MSRCIIKTYEVSVIGYPSAPYSAKSAGRARAIAWREYSECRNCTFKDFMRISAVRRIPNPPGVGEAIMVGGKLGFRAVGWNGQYVRFVWPDSDVVLCSHPLDVSAVQSLTGASTI
jgi:hypothetical protein